MFWATSSKYLKASPFFSLIWAGLWRCVKLQRLLMKMSRKLVMPTCEARAMQLRQV